MKQLYDRSGVTLRRRRGTVKGPAPSPSEASGFLLKDVSPQQLVAAARLVASGDALLAPSITRRLVERRARPAAVAPSVSPAELTALTAREREMLVLMARGLERLTASSRMASTGASRALSMAAAAQLTGQLTPLGQRIHRDDARAHPPHGSWLVTNADWPARYGRRSLPHIPMRE
jgi:hypothetical protein